MSDFDVADSIDDFLTGTYVVTRRPARTYDTDGRIETSTTSTFNLLANVQPADRVELRMPNGNYATDGIVIYSRQSLQVTQLNGGYEADVVAANGRKYEVSISNPWVQAGYFRSVALLQVAK